MLSSTLSLKAVKLEREVSSIKRRIDKYFSFTEQV